HSLRFTPSVSSSYDDIFNCRPTLIPICSIFHFASDMYSTFTITSLDARRFTCKLSTTTEFLKSLARAVCDAWRPYDLKATFTRPNSIPPPPVLAPCPPPPPPPSPTSLPSPPDAAASQVNSNPACSPPNQCNGHLILPFPAEKITVVRSSPP